MNSFTPHSDSRSRRQPALADPFNRDITLDRDFLVLPFLHGIITDQHLIERDRMGRTLTFMARIVADGWAAESKAIAIDRETAVLVDDSARATIVANPAHATPYAYFMRGGMPEVVAAEDAADVSDVRVDRAAPGSTFNLQAWTGDRPRVLHAERRERRHEFHAAGRIDY